MLDAEGIELPDLNAAREEAVLLSGGLLSEHGKQFWKDEKWKMDVTDEAGVVLFSLQFVALPPHQCRDSPRQHLA
ncbi:MAG: hypothetical protein JWL66_1002 [Sphingomonadales bacterium]|nr:hypothetical protein [Sphingomonadales bacterium]